MNKNTEYILKDIDGNDIEITREDVIDFKEKKVNFFEASPVLRENAYLNWRFRFNELDGQFYMMGEIYFETALLLLRNCIKDNQLYGADLWIFPILFNAIHGIELYLKAFNSLVNALVKLNKGKKYQEPKIEGKHDIKQLCNKAISLIKEHFKEEKDFLLDFDIVKIFIGLIYSNTDDMTFARYPITNKKEPHFYNSEENITINLNELYEWLSLIFAILERYTVATECIIDELKRNSE